MSTWGTAGVGQHERKTYKPQEVVELCICNGTDRIHQRLRRYVDAPDDASANGHRVRHRNGRTVAERGFISSGHYGTERLGWDESPGIRFERHADGGLRAAKRIADVAGYQHDPCGHIYECYRDAGESANWILERESAGAADDQHAEWNNVTGSNVDVIQRDDSLVDSFGREHGEHHRFEV